MSYAAGTTVDPSKSRLEIERLLQAVGCTRSGVMNEPGAAVIYFERKGWTVQMKIALPTDEEAKKRKASRGYGLLSESQRRHWVEQTTRERWRQLLLVLKAKFTALENGVETFEQSFFAHLVVGGVHLGDRLLSAVREANSKGAPFLLGAGPSNAAPPGSTT